MHDTIDHMCPQTVPECRPHEGSLLPGHDRYPLVIPVNVIDRDDQSEEVVTWQ